MKRQPLEIGAVIEINGIQIKIMEYIGEGSTCLTYHGKVLENNRLVPGTKVIVKEFYPTSNRSVFEIQRDEKGVLAVSGTTRSSREYQSRKQQFEAGYRMQKELANSNIMEVMVKPYLYGAFGDSLYLISDIHMGTSLDLARFETLRDRLDCAVRVVELFGILHDAGYMMTDFKPENMLWTEQPRSVKLIDADSVFRFRGENNIGEEDVLYINQKYSPSQILVLKEMIESGKGDFTDKKETYLKPQANIYSLGMFVFELLLGRMPTPEDLKFTKALAEELVALYRKELSNEKDARELLEILKRASEDRPGKRYADASHMMRALNDCIERITSRKYMTKKKIARANETYLSYNLLEQYPLYTYGHKAGQENVLDAALIGTHSLRESLFKAILSCGQMLNTVLNIHLIAEDAERFWERFSSEGCNPELKRTVRWTVNGTPVDNEEAMRSAEIVDVPLANVYLHTESNIEQIAHILKENQAAYVCLLREQEGSNLQAVEEILKRLPKKRMFVGYLAEERDLPGKDVGKAVLYPIKTEKTSELYDETIFRSHIYRMGLNIHEYYYRGTNPRATREEVRKDYARDVYQIESSERSALHANYKLASIGIDPASPDAPYLFYDKVLSSDTGEAKKLFDALTALEHRSWTAFMVLSGAKAVDTRQELAAYAFDGDENDWKDRRDPEHMGHPCLKAWRFGKVLTAADWAKRSSFTKKKWNELDPLDRRSLEAYLVIEKIAEERRESIDRCFEEIEGYVTADADADGIRDAYDALWLAKAKCFDKETSSEKLWKQTFTEFRERCEGAGVFKENLKKELGNLEHLMKPVLWVTDYHDFKEANGDILRALPMILIQNGKIQNVSRTVTILKPMAENTWQNIYSSIMVNPDLLVLVPMNGEDEKEVLKHYSQLLEACRVDTRVRVRSPKQLREYGGKEGHIFIDETGVTPYQLRVIAENPYMKHASTFEVRDRQLKPTGANKMIALFQRPVNLTVQETLMLHGAVMISERMPDYIVGLTAEEYKSLWNLYRDLRDGRKWKVFIDVLKELELKKIQRIRRTDKSMPKSYESDYIEESVLKQTNIKKVLEELAGQKLLLKYTIPGKDSYGRVSIHTEYPGLAEGLCRMIASVGAAPYGHSYQVTVTDQEILLRDDSLYVLSEIGHEQDREVTGGVFYKDDVLKEIVALLEQKNKDRVLLNLKYLPKEGTNTHVLSFRYSSDSVREVLRKEGSILEAVIFLECRKRGVFDDIRVNVEFMWPGERTKNELDIVGTRNSKTYFISAKMQVPDKMHAYEIDNLCQRFAIEGQAILVSSHYTTGKHEKRGEDFATRPYALEDRIRDMKTISYIGKDGVDRMNENNRREIIIAGSIEDIVMK